MTTCAAMSSLEREGRKGREKGKWREKGRGRERERERKKGRERERLHYKNGMIFLTNLNIHVDYSTRTLIVQLKVYLNIVTIHTCTT